MKKRHYFVLILISLMVHINFVMAETISTIANDIPTEFEVYEPVIVNVLPSVIPYDIKENLSNVVNIEDFELDSGAINLLSTNGFAAKASPYRQIYDVYNECQDSGIPIFVTTDACLHTYHILYDYVLRVIESNYFFSDLHSLTSAMIQDTKVVYEEASEPSVKEAALDNLAYLSIALQLLDPDMEVDPLVSVIVSQEVEKIVGLSPGYVPSPLFYREDYPYLEDYSQYKPRGHYTRTPEFERYFRAMMWYGRITYSLNLLGASQTGIRHAAIQALLLCRSLENASFEDEVSYPVLELWKRIYEPTVFFVGKTDDINHEAYLELALNHFSGSFTQLSPDILAQVDKLDAFITDALKLPDPKITVKAGKGYRFMGQRFIPDSYILDQLVEEFVMNRLMPRGLDVMAVLGSDRAYEIIDTMYNDPDLYPNYNEQLLKLKQEFMGYTPDKWAQNLYFNWLYTLTPLLEVKGEGYPLFMQNTAWIDKNLNSTLGSWAELRHDTILYAKQSETFESAPAEPLFIKGYVEPEPEVYARLAALGSYTRRGLLNKGLLDQLFENRLVDFENLMLVLKTIAVKELRNLTTSDEEYAFICNFGTIIEAMTSFPADFEKQYENEADEFMAVIADVHTDPVLNECLEVGVGHPLNIYVIAPVNGIPTLTKGGIFSYHEFKRPLAEERLNDEEWQEMQSSEAAQNMPEWTSSFLAGESSLKRDTYNFPSFGTVVISVEEDNVPAEFTLFQNKPNPFNPSTTISYRLQEGGWVKVVIYNLSGQLVDILVDEWQESGLYNFKWSPYNLATGIYFIKISSNDKVSMIKMLFMK